MISSANMNQPTTEPTTGPASTLVELPAALRDLHRALLAQVRDEHERTHGPVGGPGQLLHLAMNDASFAWLRVLSELMVDLDELLEEEPAPSEEEAAAIRRELDEVFSPAAPRAFWEKCAPLLQDGEVVIAYARVRSLLTRLPRAPAADDAAARLHAQHRWAVTRRKRGAP